MDDLNKIWLESPLENITNYGKVNTFLQYVICSVTNSNRVNVLELCYWELQNKNWQTKIIG